MLGTIWRLFEKAYATKYKALYIAYGLKHYPWWRRPLYLHYALFLDALTGRTSPVSRETITRLRSFADIAGRPPLPEWRLLQPAFIVPYIILLNTLILEILKRADFLEGRTGIAILSLYVFFLFMLFYVLWVLRLRLWVTDRKLQRFLQWAEYDMEEAQLLRIRRPCTGLPSDPES